jgi:S-adenosylmethionine synthetase
MEAYSGKNNHNHIGKIYQRWASEEAKKISLANHGRYTEVILVGKIGQSIKDYEMYVNY